MRNYDRIHARKPQGIENRKAYIVGGGIAGLSAAAFLVRDAYMPGENIIVYDKLPVFGGSMDECGNEETGYISRGERELEPYMECLWDLFGSIPSLYEEGRTVLDETRECNREHMINAKHRLWEKDFIPCDESDMGLNKVTTEQLMKMLTIDEKEIEYVTIEQWFDKSFFQSNLWYYWSAMLAFQPYQSLIEMKRYAIRFMHQLHLIKSLKQILHTKYDQYHSMILPLQKYLSDHGVKFVADTEIIDMDIQTSDGKKTVTALRLKHNGKISSQAVDKNDMVFFTNGSMTQNSTRGSMTEAPIINLDKAERGCFTLWEKLATKADNFGRPETFISEPMKTDFVTVTATIKDYPQLFRYFEEKSENKAGTGGIQTFIHSPWYMNYGIAMNPLDPNQPENVDVFFIYGLHANEIGHVVKKRMIDCSGEEILKEFLYWIGLEDKYDEIREHAILIPTVMPYITSQFMPRGKKDRPEIIPEGSQNLAFIGQFVELPGDVVFTVETSVRTAMTAVYKMTNLDKPIVPLFEGHYDVRMVKAGLLTMINKTKLKEEDLPKINPLKIKSEMAKLVDAINDIPDVPEIY